MGHYDFEDFLIVRWSPGSVFRRNLICLQHGIIKGMVLKLDGVTPILQLQGEVFELIHDPEADLLSLQLPLQATGLRMAPLGHTCFFPSDHYMLNRSMDVTVGQGIVRDAGLEAVDMQRYFDRHQDLYFEFPRWLTADLCGVPHPSHLPQLVPDTWDPFDLTVHYRRLSLEEDDAEEPYFRSPPCMSISTLRRCANMPKIRASFVGKGPPPHPSVVSYGNAPPPRPSSVNPED